MAGESRNGKTTAYYSKRVLIEHSIDRRSDCAITNAIDIKHIVRQCIVVYETSNRKILTYKAFISNLKQSKLNSYSESEQAVPLLRKDPQFYRPVIL
jgi:hypothetical protein